MNTEKEPKPPAIDDVDVNNMSFAEFKQHMKDVYQLELEKYHNSADAARLKQLVDEAFANPDAETIKMHRNATYSGMAFSGAGVLFVAQSTDYSWLGMCALISFVVAIPILWALASFEDYVLIIGERAAEHYGTIMKSWLSMITSNSAYLLAGFGWILAMADKSYLLGVVTAAAVGLAIWLNNKLVENLLNEVNN